MSPRDDVDLRPSKRRRTSSSPRGASLTPDDATTRSVSRQEDRQLTPCLHEIKPLSLPSGDPNRLSPTTLSVLEQAAQVSTSSHKAVVDELSPERRVSFYVQAVDELINQVLTNESYLFSPHERHALNRLRHAHYSTRYLFVRLYLRKDSWIRQSNIGYENDVDDVEQTCQDLCQEIVFTPDVEDKQDSDKRQDKQSDQLSCHQPLLGSDAHKVVDEKPQNKLENPTFIDLTGDDDEDDDDEEITIVPIDCTTKTNGRSNRLMKGKPSRRTSSNSATSADESKRDPIFAPNEDEDDGEGDLSRLALDKDYLVREEDPQVVLNLLTMEEIVNLGKRMKVNAGKGTRREYTKALLKTSNQSLLSFGGAASSNRAVAKSLNTMNGKQKGKLKSKPGAFGLSFDSKGNSVKASSLTSQQALRTIGQVIRLNPAYRRLFDRLSLVFHRTTYTAANTTSFVASLLARFGKRHYPSYTVSRTFSIFPSRDMLRQYERALAVERKIEDILGETGFTSSSSSSSGGGPTLSSTALKELAAIRRLKTSEEKRLEKEQMCADGVALFAQVEQAWRKICNEAEQEMKQEEDDQEKRLLYYRRRFHPGWPLTRVAYKAASIYATLHDRDREVELLRALLAQSSFRRGNRGAWYDRLALILMRYPLGQENDATLDTKRKQKLERRRKLDALELCLKGLEDPYTHLIYHSSLQRRIMRIESWLDVPKNERRVFAGALRKATERIMQGERLDDPTTGRKSVWQATNGAEVSVEELVLEQYVREGWKGFHSENGILTTIFTLVFWDIVFAPVNGVFETAYQSRPLDLTTDAFAVVRRPLIDARLEAIRHGQATEFLEVADDRERPLNTFAVGVNWARYSKQDLIEIVESIGGEALAPIMTMFCEDYENRVGGIPDLCLWNHDKRVCKFVEVKGPGDHLSETQKVWIDVLLNVSDQDGRVQVELCHVMTHEDKDEYDQKQRDKARKKNPKTKGTKAKGRGRSKSAVAGASPSEAEGADDDDEGNDDE
ncbi:hypothetical protein OIO90_004108 [Microbotryomycetes sp. JL221]|nr:hypothetical protein OIO90_004108 [Microbotryomycetes sp. JL221]